MLRCCGVTLYLFYLTDDVAVEQSTVRVFGAVDQSRGLRGSACQLGSTTGHNDSVSNVSLSFQNKIQKKEMGEPERGVTECDIDVSDHLYRLHLQ